MAPFRKCQHFLSQNNENIGGGPFREKSLNTEKKKGGTLWDFPTSILLQNIKEIEGDPMEEKNRKIPQCRKTERGPFGVSQHPFCRKTSKIEGTLWRKISIFAKKVSQCRKKLKGGPFGLARYCMLRGKKEKPFWFSSLGQVQFDTIKFRRIL